MDRSFLSDASVVAASRNFVCIRLMTYEDAAEAEFIKSIYIGKSGQLENTTFAILSPDGKQKLTATGRAPFHEYRGSRDMATGMNEIAETYEGAREAALSDTRLPFIKTLDLGLNVSSADGLPLVVVVADNQDQVDNLESRLLPLVWSKTLAGQFACVSVLNREGMKPVTGAPDDVNGILIVEPGQFGLSGKVLAHFDADTSPDEMKSKMADVIANFPRPHKDHNSHVRLGIELGIDWKSQIPETDQQSLRAKDRARGRQAFPTVDKSRN